MNEFILNYFNLNCKKTFNFITNFELYEKEKSSIESNNLYNFFLFNFVEFIFFL